MSPKSAWLLQEEIMPRLISAIPQTVSFIGSEDPEELVQDSIAMASKLLTSVERSRKKVTPGNVAYYTIQHLKSGRRSTGSSISDVYGSATQLNGRTRLTSLDEVAASDEEAGGEIFLLQDVLSSDQEDPATKAARKMDWDSFMAGLSERDQAIIEFMVEGKPLSGLARRRGFNASTLRYRKEQLAKAIAEFMGADIMVEVVRQPQWKDGLDATRERLACREERRH